MPAVPYRNPNNYVKYSARLAEVLGKSETEGAIWANQFDNTANRDIHIDDDGGGDLGRHQRQGRRLRLRGRLGRHARRRRARSRGSAPTSASHSPIRRAPRSTPTIRKATLKAEGSSITEGIGQGRITANLEGAPIDAAYHIPDVETCASSSISSPRKVSAWGLRAASTSRAPSAWQESSAQVIPS